MEIPSIQLSLEHIEELDFTCPAAKKSINIGKEIIPVKFVVNIYPDVKRDYFKLITGVRYIRHRNFIGQELLFYRIAVVYKIEKLGDFVKLENSQVTVVEYINRVDERNVGTTYAKYSVQKLSVTSDKCIRNINFHEYNRF